MGDTNIFLGIDLGIGSCGWALAGESSLIALGARIFDVPETAKERTPTNQLRRQARGLRRVTTRRRQRMNAIRALLRQHGLLDDDGKHSLGEKQQSGQPCPWQLRAEGLDRLLTAKELAIALGHMAKHRGFQSNSKRDQGANAASETGKVLAATAKNTEASAQWRTIGEMFWKSPEFQIRKRNRDKDYSRSVLRSDLAYEVRVLLAQQRRLGNGAATVELEAAFMETAFHQRPLADSEDKVGPCPFEAGEIRAPKHCPSFELFRLLSRLTSLRIGDRALAPSELSLAVGEFGRQQGLSYSRLRKILSLSDDQAFQGVNREDEGKRDVVARSGKAMPGSAALFKVLGEAGWQSLSKTPETLDRIAVILAFRDDAGRIQAGLEDLDLSPPILGALLEGVRNGTFKDFKGAGHISAKACRKIIPYLVQGLVYSDACAQAGYNHADRPHTSLDDIANPIARKALTEARKQIKAIIHSYGRPTHIHVELARDVGKSLEERQELENGIAKRTKEKERLRDQFRDQTGQTSVSAEDLLRFELWKEQNGRCLYTDTPIPIDAVAADDNRVQVDHILPWSRSGDDSYRNKTLCWAKANQDKKGRTPFEWLGGDQAAWQRFALAVEGCPSMKGMKKRNYLLKDSSLLEGKFRSRNLNDTRYACRLLLAVLQQDYPDITIAARPGPLTDRLRRAWGAQSLKKDETGERRPDDRHHALDAAIVALTSQSMLQRLTNLFQEAERRGLPTNWHGIGHLADLFRDSGGLPRDFSALEPPWPTFRADLAAALQSVTVSRAERRRARGEAHAATIRRIAQRDGEPMVFERKSVDKLSEKDLDNIPDPDRNQPLIHVLRQWLADGKPTDRPISPQGHPIAKVRLCTTKKVDVLIRDGAAERGEMTRVDVFRQANKKGKWTYFLVPIYPHQVADQQHWPQPPNRAVVAHKPETEWPVMDAGYEFLWSLYPMSWVEVVKSDGEVIEGYFRSYDRDGGALKITPHFSNQAKPERPGAKTLASFRKFAVDRFGNRFEILQEVRTWHGVACTSANQPD